MGAVPRNRHTERCSRRVLVPSDLLLVGRPICCPFAVVVAVEKNSLCNSRVNGYISRFPATTMIEGSLSIAWLIVSTNTTYTNDESLVV
jgi:hypothetical protein